jgi:hypothetical protein
MLAWYAWRLMPTIGPCLSMLPLLLQAYLQCRPVVDSLLNSCLRLSSPAVLPAPSSAAQWTWLQNLNHLLNLLGQGPASGGASSTNRTRCSYDSAPKLVAVSMHLSCCLTPWLICPAHNRTCGCCRWISHNQICHEHGGLQEQHTKQSCRDPEPRTTHGRAGNRSNSEHPGGSTRNYCCPAQ